MVSVEKDVGLIYKSCRKKRMEHVYEEIIAGSCKKMKYVCHTENDENRPTPCKRNKDMLHTPLRLTSPASNGCQDSASRVPFTSTSILNDRFRLPDDTYLCPVTNDKSKQFKSQGQLKLAASISHGVLSVHVIQGRQLSTREKPLSTTIVKVAIVPDGDVKQCSSKTSIVSDTNNPLFDHKFSFIIAEEDLKKRVHISLWNNNKKSSSEFLGGMSFGIQHILNPTKEVMGWFHFLTEEISQHKHLRVSTKARMTPYKKCPSPEKKSLDIDTITVSLSRRGSGFGFTVVDSCPVKVGKVDKGSPAAMAGLCPGDHVVAVNGHNVSKSHSSSVAKIVKNGGATLILDIQHAGQFSILQQSLWQQEPTLLLDPMDIRPSHDRGYTSESDLSDSDEGIYSWPSNHTSTPKKDNSQSSASDKKMSKLIHRLQYEESNFINIMQAGMQKYSRPLRHSILTTQQHITLFQNIEKLVMISQFQVKQIQNNIPTSSESSSSDSDSSSSSTATDTAQHISKIYQSKISMLCQAYDLYAKGITAANRVLSDLSSSDDFIKFVRSSSLEGSEPSISSFIYLPIQHIVRVYNLLTQILTSVQDTYLHSTMEAFQSSIQSMASYPSVSQILNLASLSPLPVTQSATGTRGHCDGQPTLSTFQEY